MDMHGGGFSAGDTTAAQHVRLAGGGTAAAVAPVTLHHRDDLLIGEVIDISGSASRMLLDAATLGELSTSADAAVAMAGQVGAQVKIRVGSTWLVASIRDQQLHERGEGLIVATIDFLGEGEEEKITGRIHNFRRGVTRYPIPGSQVYAATSHDLKQIYAADERAHVEIGNVYPTKDIRGSLYVDAMLGKHFALLGSTGTGKSTSAALILHKICELAPQGHIVMIDPHGEYSAAFKQTGMIFDVSNLQMPYWLMNFEEHCEVFLTTTGNDRQEDADILSKCLLQARSKNRLAETMGKITVDSPIPYLLSDLTTIIQNEMGKLDKASTAWNQLATGSGTTAVVQALSGIAAKFRDTKSPEVEFIVKGLDELHQAADAILGSCAELAQSCSEYKTSLDDLRTKMKETVEDLVEELAISANGLVVAQTPTGEFVSGWRVSAAQAENILKQGKLGGG